MEVVKKENVDITENTVEKQKPVVQQQDTLKILEWRFNQFLGEKLSEEDFKQEENQSYLISDIKLTNNGEYLIMGDKGGRVIIFKRTEGRNKLFPKLNYFFEFAACEKDFDVHKSTEYSEQVRALAILPMMYNDKIDILSCGYRTVKLHRVHNYKIRNYTNYNDHKNMRNRRGTRHSSGSDSDNYYDDEDDTTTTTEDTFLDHRNRNNIGAIENGELNVPQVKSFRYDVTAKCKKCVKIPESSEINSISYNKYTENFIVSDENKILLFNINHTNDAYNVIDMEANQTEEEQNHDLVEKITIAKMSERDAHIFTYGSSSGNIKLCDIRSNSDCLKWSSNYIDEFQNITNSGFNLTKTVFSNQIMAVHDILPGLGGNENLFASRHFLSVNLWDKRNNKAPVSKFLCYEPVIPKLSYLYMKNYLGTDKFSLSCDKSGKHLLTGGYSYMFHCFDIDQKLNTQITIDGCNEKLMNTNVIRKINSKGSCFYKKDDPNLMNINFNNKILKHCYSNTENLLTFAIQNCVYTYSGNIIIKETQKKAS
jgi:serine/threonine-protein phosphatase 2A regulatory subunit B